MYYNVHNTEHTLTFTGFCLILTVGKGKTTTTTTIAAELKFMSRFYSNDTER